MSSNLPMHRRSKNPSHAQRDSILRITETRKGKGEEVEIPPPISGAALPFDHALCFTCHSLAAAAGA
jgi:hypothetical protein